MSDLQQRQFERAEQQWLREPAKPEEPRCACCGCRRSHYTELYLYGDEPWCYDCLEYEGIQPWEIDELAVYESEE